MAGSRAAALLVLAALALSAANVSVVAAQRGASSAPAPPGPDSLLALGRLTSAESAYYAESRARPRDPEARSRLGRFLAARGALRVGAVLLEEARDFGGDSARIASDLARLYERLADYRALLALRPVMITPVQQRRAEWLASRPPRVAFEDSVVSVPYRAAPRGPGFGTALLRVGRAELAASIDPDARGVHLPASVRSYLVTFGDSAAVATIRLGPMTFENVSATVVAVGDAARVGFDVLAPYSPTFDPRAERITLHRPERRWRPPPGTHVPALVDAAGMRLLLAGGWQPASAPTVVRLLGSRAWTWDARRGDIVLLTP